LNIFTNNKFFFYTFLAIYYIGHNNLDINYVTKVWKLSNRHAKIITTLIDFIKVSEKFTIKENLIYSFNKNVDCFKEEDFFNLSDVDYFKENYNYRKLFLIVSLLIKRSLGFSDSSHLIQEIVSEKYYDILNTDLNSVYSDIEFEFVKHAVSLLTLEELNKMLVEYKYNVTCKEELLNMLEYNDIKNFQKNFRKELFKKTNLEKQIKNFIIESNLNDKKLELIKEIINKEYHFKTFYTKFIKDITSDFISKLIYN
jgi:hypothetical protein